MFETGPTAAFTMSSDLRGSHLFSPVECRIDLTLHEPTSPHDVIRPPVMKDPRPSTKTKTSHFVLDPPANKSTASILANNNRIPARANTLHQHKADKTSESDMKTPVLPINNLQQASTSESESIPTTLPQPVMMNFYALLTPGSDKKLPEEPMKHCQLATKSDTEETSTISALQATQHLNQAKTSRLQMMVHKLRMHRCQRQLTAPHGRGPLTPVLAPPQPPPSSIKKALRLACPKNEEGRTGAYAQTHANTTDRQNQNRQTQAEQTDAIGSNKTQTEVRQGDNNRIETDKRRHRQNEQRTTKITIRSRRRRRIN